MQALLQGPVGWLSTQIGKSSSGSFSLGRSSRLNAVVPQTFVSSNGFSGSAVVPVCRVFPDRCRLHAAAGVRVDVISGRLSKARPDLDRRHRLLGLSHAHVPGHPVVRHPVLPCKASSGEMSNNAGA